MKKQRTETRGHPKAITIPVKDRRATVHRIPQAVLKDLAKRPHKPTVHKIPRYYETRGRKAMKTTEGKITREKLLRDSFASKLIGPITDRLYGLSLKDVKSFFRHYELGHEIVLRMRKGKPTFRWEALAVLSRKELAQLKRDYKQGLAKENLDHARELIASALPGSGSRFNRKISGRRDGTGKRSSPRGNSRGHRARKNR